MTPVIFRKWKDNGEIIAIFPTILVDEDFNVQSYMRSGQHAGVNYYNLLQVTKLATPEEYKYLLKELESMGYCDLHVNKKMSYKMFLELREQYRDAYWG